MDGELRIENADDMSAPHLIEASSDGVQYHESAPYCFKLYESIKNAVKKDVRDECKLNFNLTWPISLSMILIFMIPILTLVFIGHYKHQELASVGMALSFSILFGLTFVSGFSSTSITLASPAFAAGNKRFAGVILQRTFALSIILMLPLTALWINAGKIFVLLRIRRKISSAAQEFLLYHLPALLLQNTHAVLHRFLASQGLVLPLIWCTFAGVVLHPVITCALVFLANLGVRGAAFAADITWFLVNVFLVFYLKYYGLMREVWPGFTAAWLLDWGKFILLAVPSVSMLFIEIAVFQYGTFLLGSIDGLQFEIHTVFYYVALVIYASSHGISNAASIRIGSLLTIGDERALRVAVKALLLNVCFLYFLIGILLIILKDVMGYLFTDRSDVISGVSRGIPLLSFFVLLDGIQAVLGGVLQGAGLQRLCAIVNFIGYIVVAIPVGSVIVTGKKLGALGYWIGLTCGAAMQVLTCSLLLWSTDFKKRSIKARQRAGLYEDSDELGEMRATSEIQVNTEEDEGHDEELGTVELNNATDDRFFSSADVNVTLTKRILLKRSILFLASICSLIVGVVFAW